MQLYPAAPSAKIPIRFMQSPGNSLRKARRVYLQRHGAAGRAAPKKVDGTGERWYNIYVFDEP